MFTACDYQTELKWYKTVLREAEAKNNRYPWNVQDFIMPPNPYNDTDISTPIINPPKTQRSNTLLDTSSKKIRSNSKSSLNSTKITSSNYDRETDSESEGMEYRIKPYKPSSRKLSLALDKFLKGVDMIEKDLKSIKKSTKIN
ncbi:hypothetical protein SteCoe_16402 [Stentor coeruleus]|uniref:Uncharacterized protein n=1 Tax=Stentor coeruleus TaxID=5963 RepID=A0A1R2C1J6_9CILI|nr:hypothetical protein SteCoe_16402 [Stentor coeruleus]